MRLTMISASLIALLAAMPATAQNNDTGGDAAASNASADDVAVLNNWTYEPLYDSAHSVERLIYSTDVYGPAGNEIGTVENVIFADDGQALSLIAEVGGFWDIGDTHVNIPWEEVDITTGANRAVVPVTEASVDDYDIFGEAPAVMSDADENVAVVDDDLATGLNTFKATDLIGDNAYLNDGAGYGYINDLLVGPQGQIDAIVMDAAAYGTPGYYAYPYQTYQNWQPGSPRYRMPYAADSIGRIENFDYDRLNTTS